MSVFFIILSYRIIDLTSNTTLKIIATIQNGIHSGDNTHHQDQSFTLHNFNVMNTIANILVKPKLKL